jgi:hypothetical protein
MFYSKPDRKILTITQICGKIRITVYRKLATNKNVEQHAKNAAHLLYSSQFVLQQIILLNFFKISLLPKIASDDVSLTTWSCLMSDINLNMITLLCT